MNVNNPQSATTQTTLATGAELVYLVMRELMGEALASSLNQAPLTRNAMQDLIASRIKHNLSKTSGV